MDISYSLVASKCADQMSQFQKCVFENEKKEWGSICQAQSQALSKCADEKVPQLATLKTKCDKQIQLYTKCLDANSHKSEDQIKSTCGKQMSALWSCSDGVLSSSGGTKG